MSYTRRIGKKESQGITKTLSWDTAATPKDGLFAISSYLESNPPPKGDPKAEDYRKALRAVQAVAADLAAKPRSNDIPRPKADPKVRRAPRRAPAVRIDLESSDSESGGSEDGEVICGAKCLHRVIRCTKVPASFSLPIRHHEYSGAGNPDDWLKGHLDAILRKGGTTITALQFLQPKLTGPARKWFLRLPEGSIRS